MMFRLILTGVIASLIGAKSFANDITQPVSVNISLKKAYFPVGFDSNDRIQFAVEGELVNSCFKMGSYTVKVDKESRRIEVYQQAYVYLGYCLMMIIPFSTIVDVGVLENPGEYTIIDGANKKILGKLPIVAANGSGQDDYLYAPLEDAYVTTSDTSPKQSLVLTGYFPDRCMEFSEVKINMFSDAIVVQPIVKQVAKVGGCPPEKIRFIKTVPFIDDLHGAYLLHVRSLNGAAINRVLEFQ